MTVVFKAAGCLHPIDEGALGAGFDDAFTKIDMRRAHHAAVGQGADFAERFIR